MDQSALLERLSGVQAAGPGQHVAKCPAHQDREASLSVGMGRDRVLLERLVADSRIPFSLPDYRRPPRPFALRFWEKVDTSGECWIWQGAINHRRRGYGWFSWQQLDDDGRIHKTSGGAHRMAYMLSSGEIIPPGIVVMHACDNPPCVRPHHLRLGTAAENTADSIAKGRFVMPPPPRPQRGELNPYSKLTDAQRLSVAARLRAGESAPMLAAEFAVHPETIRRTIRGAR
jgi:hypothetical protein